MRSEVRESSRQMGETSNGSCEFNSGETHSWHSPKWPEYCLIADMQRLRFETRAISVGKMLLGRKEF